jgi:hypothetical protein
MKLISVRIENVNENCIRERLLTYLKSAERARAGSAASG